MVQVGDACYPPSPGLAPGAAQVWPVHRWFVAQVVEQDDGDVIPLSGCSSPGIADTTCSATTICDRRDERIKFASSRS